MENFIPVLCGERRGNKRTIATNVREEDISALYDEINSGGFLVRVFYKVKVFDEMKLARTHKRINKELDKEKEEQNFWKRFIETQDESLLQKVIKIIRRLMNRRRKSSEHEESEDFESKVQKAGLKAKKLWINDPFCTRPAWSEPIKKSRKKFTIVERKERTYS